MLCDDFGYSVRCRPIDPVTRHVRNMAWVDAPIVQPLGVHSGRRYILSYTVDVWWLVEPEMCVITIWQPSCINCNVNVLRGRLLSPGAPLTASDTLSHPSRKVMRAWAFV